jgi:hypothetical protein
MNIVDELRAAAVELALKSKIEQSAWTDSLIDGWVKNRSMAWVLAHAARMPGTPIEPYQWDLLVSAAAGLKPSLRAETNLRIYARVWIANNARYASDALWDGRIDQARVLMAKGGKRADGRAKNRKEAKEAAKKEAGGVLVVRTRERDKRHDWGTCK